MRGRRQAKAEEKPSPGVQVLRVWRADRSAPPYWDRGGHPVSKYSTQSSQFSFLKQSLKIVPAGCFLGALFVWDWLACLLFFTWGLWQNLCFWILGGSHGHPLPFSATCMDFLGQHCCALPCSLVAKDYHPLQAVSLSTIPLEVLLPSGEQTV